MKKLLIVLLLLLFAVPALGATLSWNASDRATGYLVYYNEYSNDVGNVTEIADFENTLNLVAGVDYNISVSAYNEYGESAKCDAIVFTRQAFIPDTNPAPVIINIPPDTPSVTINVGN